MRKIFKNNNIQEHTQGYTRQWIWYVFVIHCRQCDYKDKDLGETLNLYIISTNTFAHIRIKSDEITCISLPGSTFRIINVHLCSGYLNVCFSFHVYLPGAYPPQTCCVSPLTSSHFHFLTLKTAPAFRLGSFGTAPRKSEKNQQYHPVIFYV